MSPITMHHESSALPFIRLDPAQIPPKYHFEAWRDSVSPLFNTKPLGGESFHNYYVDASAFLVDSLVVGLTSFSQQRYQRTQRKSADDETDHFLLQIYTSGQCVGSNGNRHFNMDSQTVSLLDLSRPLDSYARDSTSLNIVIPREVMREYAGGVDGLHGRTLSTCSSRGALLAGHMNNLWQLLPRATPTDAKDIATTTAMLTAALFKDNHQYPLPDSPAVRQVTIDSLRRYIDQHLLDPMLSIETLCRQHNLSRSTVYRLFKPLGSVMGYIVQQRLMRSYQMLQYTHGRQIKIIDIAMQCGFSNVSHFNYVFKRTFDLTPRDVLGMGNSHAEALTEPSGDDFMNETRKLAQWLVKL